MAAECSGVWACSKWACENDTSIEKRERSLGASICCSDESPRHCVCSGHGSGVVASRTIQSSKTDLRTERSNRHRHSRRAPKKPNPVSLTRKLGCIEPFPMSRVARTVSRTRNRKRELSEPPQCVCVHSFESWSNTLRKLLHNNRIENRSGRWKSWSMSEHDQSNSRT